MAALHEIARQYADEIRDGIAWVIIWKTGRSWNAEAFWLNCDDDTFEPEDLNTASEILKSDPNAVMVNGYYCGHFGENMTIKELADGIRWHYEGSCNLLKDSAAFPPEPIPRPENLPADIPWYGKETTADPDPYIYDGYMSVEDYELMYKHMEADRQQVENTEPEGEGIWIWNAGVRLINGETQILNNPNNHELQRPTLKPPEITPPDVTLTLTISEPDQARALLTAASEAIAAAMDRMMQTIRKLYERLVKAATAAAKIARDAVNRIVDAMLYNANDHPKWWHLYKHARKWRTRKKYKRLLMKQLCSKLAAG